MKINKIITQIRRDFTAEYICEHCGATTQGSGYDDSHFHNNVIPNIECKACGKTSSDDYRPLAPKYPENAIV